MKLGISEIKYYLRLIKLNGFSWAISAFFSRLAGHKLKNFAAVKSYFKNKRGLEIGGPSSIFKSQGLFPVYPIAGKIDNCNFANRTLWEKNLKDGKHYSYYKHKKGIQFIREGVNLRNIKSKTYDFVISSHTIEHIANPLKALNEWLRILKDEGALLLIIPHKDGTFDHNRDITSLNHLVKDMTGNIDERDLTHLPEILKFHDFKLDSGAKDAESFKRRSLTNPENRGLHHHVFNTALAAQMFDQLNIQIIFIRAVKPFHIIIMSKKIKNKKIVDNGAFISESAEYHALSPFKSDKK